MNTLLAQLEDEVVPLYAIAVYKFKNSGRVYTETARMRNGNTMAFHPTTLREAGKIAAAMCATDQRLNFLQTKGIVSSNILSIGTVGIPRVIWYTPAMRTGLLFHAELGIENGVYPIPPMVWDATRDSLHVYALQVDQRPTADTQLFMPPYHNIFDTCGVCMGSVDIEQFQPECLEDFVESWQRYFFSSYFVHLGSIGNPTRSPLCEVWKNLHNTDKPFPLDELLKYKKTLKDIL